MDYFESLLNSTPARLQIGRAGSRYTTDKLLEFRMAHAQANDAVMSEASSTAVNSLGLMEFKTKCNNKYEMLTRPDWGRVFDPSTKEEIKKHCSCNVDVQIYCGDGLSSPSISANIPSILPILTMSLQDKGITVGTPFFVRYCRVNTAREIGPLLNATVVCVLIGERPGLITDESMSAYIAYKPNENMSESDYTVVSNISRVGMAPVEAGAYIADVIEQMLKYKASGIELKKYL